MRTWPVELRVYDLSGGMAKQLSMPLLGKQIDGIWHTGVHVFGREYFYGGGIQAMPPSSVVARYGMEPVQVLPLGSTSVSQERLEAFLREINDRFTAETYDLIQNNCNNFSNEVSHFLLGKGIPQHILDLPNEALSTPLGAMLRPMIENMQREMQRTGAQPFAIPFNDTSRVHADASPLTASASSSVAMPESSQAKSATGFILSSQPSLHLCKIVDRVAELNHQHQKLTDDQLRSLRQLPDEFVAHGQDKEYHAMTNTQQYNAVQQWEAVWQLLREGCGSPLFFPALGVFRVLLLRAVDDSKVVEVKNHCFEELLKVAESQGADTISDAQMTMVLSVLINAFANPVASDMVLTRAVQFLPFVFKQLSESTNADHRQLSALVVRNCCSALKLEEELLITTIVCGCAEVLDRLSNDSSITRSTPTVEAMVQGIRTLLANFSAARSLCVDLGLAEVLRRLQTAPALNAIRPLLVEAVSLI